MEKKRKVTALINFRDRNNFEKEYIKGEYISHFDDDKKKEIIGKGYAIEHEEKPVIKKEPAKVEKPKNKK